MDSTIVRWGMLVVRLGIVAATVAGLAALPSPAAAGPPVGLIREIRIHSNVPDITGGPEGDLWFTTNLRQDAIGRITPGGKVKKFKPLAKGVEPDGIVTGSDGNVWFTYERNGFGFSGGGVGRITPKGRVTLFPEPPELHGSPFEIVAGPDGNLWFDHAAILTPTGQAIGRITPHGEVSEFSAGLAQGAAVTNLTAGPDGNVWFADNSDHPAIGRITPSGEITEFVGIPPREFPILEGPAPGPDGNLWFSANEPTTAVERISPGGTITRFDAGLDRRAEFVGPFVAGSDGNVWFRVEKSASRRQRNPEIGTTAIGRITPSGKISEFSHCLRPLPLFAGPNFLTPGPEGNVWFTTRQSGESSRPTPASIPSIGRITPSGKISEFRYGLDEQSEPEDLTVAGGRLWFVDRLFNSIGEITPPRRPANTFLVSFPEGHAGIRVKVVVPGAGSVRIQETGVVTHGHRKAVPGLVSRALSARACGPVSLPLPFRPGLQRLLAKRHHFRLALRVTFKPRGGTPFSERTGIALVRR
jgi:streptogramin lyase